ncbi:hypothetical protein U9M48_041859 [Paspalum notatum var. saurae]|uniref:Agenet domain-containing protein n=1 Tax=Paspalum notatum var. saurae TaxID=547442 RepID=A0AAQ3XFD1_PASNO
MDLLLPYKIGDHAESKSSVIGFRGAWFRCKVLNMRVNDLGYLEYYLKYIDYDEEEMEWVGVFQKNPASSNQNSGESTEIMIRPSFPQWYYGHEVPEQLPVSDVTAIVDETWKVGDLVDWFKQGCFWSGKITKLLNKDMIKIELPAPPIGEGRCYSAKRKDLRPTLEWSLAKGWTVPLAQAKGKSWHTARLLQHYRSEPDKSTSGDETSSDDEDGGDENGDVQQSVSRASNVPQEASGPMVPASPPATNSASSQNARKDVAPRSQPAGAGISVRQEPGVGTTAEQEQGSSLSEGEVDDGADEYLEKLDTIEARIKYFLERTHLASKDASGK